MSKIARMSKIALRNMFQELREAAAKKDRYWMTRNGDEIKGFIKALRYEKKITEKQYYEIIDIIQEWSIFGVCRPLKVRRAA